MGMAASQARLLSITARLSDVELEAQHIQSQKIQLATQRDEVYQNYCEALDAKKIQVAFHNLGSNGTAYVDASFESMCLYDKTRGTNYVLTDTRDGRIFVTDQVKNAYDNFSGDKYLFAMAMLGLDGVITEGNEFLSMGNFGSSQVLDSKICMTKEEQAIYNELVANGDNKDLEAAHKEYVDAAKNPNTPKDELKEKYNTFRDKLYNTAKESIYNKMCKASGNTGYDFPENLDLDEFNFYVSLFDKIKSAGGCKVMDVMYMSGSEGNKWLNDMVESGRVTISMSQPGSRKWSDTSVATSTSQNWLQRNSDDTNLKKAEAEYEYELGKISSKDKKFDQDLSKLETERTALKTERDALKNIIKENTDRTYNIFS